ncbi:hypothetical protein [Mycobacterium sp. NPDC050853]|uniref:hypothetical protein n=1 Tax=Mycobacteriaceae TaxID=1762 RepID=UPI0015DDA7BB|nr:hypothetical protein [Mycobacteroides sp. LB1]
MSANAAAWESLRAVRFVVLGCFLPILLYRIWRITRHPTSVPAYAALAFGVWAWIWLLIFDDWVWSLLPPSVRTISMGGWPAITIVACLQVFVVGIAGDASPARIRRGLRNTSVVAVLVLIVITVLASHSRVIGGMDDINAAAEILRTDGDPAAVAAFVISNVYVIFVVVQLAWVGFRHADRTPVGIGLGLLTAASIAQIVESICGGIWGPLTRGEGFMGSAYGLWLQTGPGGIAAILMVLGFLWAPVMLRVQARREMRRLRPLHDALTDIFPGLVPPAESWIRLLDKVFEWSTHIQDGLTLLAQSRQVPLETDTPVLSGKLERALAVANWLVGQTVPGFSSEWLRAPDGVSDEAWVLAIAEAYRERQEGLEALASLSGMPSTLRR